MSFMINLKKYICVVLLVILAGCQAENPIVHFKDYKYVISMTDTMTKGGKILFIDDTHKNSTVLNFEGQAINDITQFNSRLYFHSMRINQHFELDVNGNLAFYANSMNGDNSLAYASWVTRQGETTLIESINGGLQVGGYESAIIYSKNNVKKDVLLKGHIIRGVIEHNKMLYIATDIPNAGFGFLVFDMTADSIKKELTFIHDFLSSRGDLLKVNNKIITYGSTDGIADYDGKPRQSGLVSIDTNTYESNEFLLPNGDIIYKVYVYNDVVYAVTEKGFLYQFDENLIVKEKLKIEHQKLIEFYESENIKIRSIVSNGDKLYILIRDFNDDNPKHIGKIYVFKKENLEVLDSFNITDVNNHKIYENLRLQIIE